MSVFDPPSDPYGDDKNCIFCGKHPENPINGWECVNSECAYSDKFIADTEKEHESNYQG